MCEKADTFRGSMSVGAPKVLVGGGPMWQKTQLHPVHITAVTWNDALVYSALPPSCMVLFQYLVTMLKLLGLLVRACSRPGPEATTLLGSHPSVTDTLKGLFGTGVPSYRTWTLCTPERRSEEEEHQSSRG